MEEDRSVRLTQHVEEIAQMKAKLRAQHEKYKQEFMTVQKMVQSKKLDLLKCKQDSSDIERQLNMLSTEINRKSLSVVSVENDISQIMQETLEVKRKITAKKAEALRISGLCSRGKEKMRIYEEDVLKDEKGGGEGMTEFIDACFLGHQVHEFAVAMTCEGCSNAVKRVLGKLEGAGVDNVDIDLASKKVFVTSSLPSDQLLETLKKTGKECSYVGVKA